MPINPYISAPRAPHGFIDDEDCICVARYDEFRYFNGSSKSRFSKAARALRIHFGGFESGGGFRGRGTILWMLRVMKLNAWYEQHVFCSDLAELQEAGQE